MRRSRWAALFVVAAWQMASCSGDDTDDRAVECVDTESSAIAYGQRAAPFVDFGVVLRSVLREAAAVVDAMPHTEFDSGDLADPSAPLCVFVIQGAEAAGERPLMLVVLPLNSDGNPADGFVAGHLAEGQLEPEWWQEVIPG